MNGTVLVTVNHRDRQAVVPTVKRLAALGFQLAATSGTAKGLRAAGLEVREVLKVSQGRPNIVDEVKSGKVALVVNTPLGADAFRDGLSLRSAAVQHNVPCITTLSGAAAAAEAMEALQRNGHPEVMSLQELHAEKVAVG
jgi:carbamoyl-phosphate synthase large subunit